MAVNLNSQNASGPFSQSDGQMTQTRANFQDAVGLFQICLSQNA
jgi:hypothetical protein